MIPAEAVEAAEFAVAKEMRNRTYDRHAYSDEVFIEGVTDIARAALEAAAPYMLAGATRLIGELTDPDDCHFDHHGGCQAHGYLDLEIGEMCPQLEAKAWAHNHTPTSEGEK